MHKRLFISLLLFLLALPLAFAAYDSRYFSVKDNAGPYSALPGEEVVVRFTLANRDLLCPYNVTAYFDPCPVGWECEEKLFCYDDDGNYEENLTIKLPSTVSPKKYTTYVLLKGDYRTRRGNDRILLTVLTKEQAATIDYTKPVVKDEPVEEAPIDQAVEEVAAEIDAVPEPEPVVEIPEVEQPPMPEDNKSQLMDDVERLESNKGFMEYVSVVLVVLLVFVAAGAYITFKKEK
jgi:hypothetical protein